MVLGRACFIRLQHPSTTMFHPSTTWTQQLQGFQYSTDQTKYQKLLGFDNPQALMTGYSTYGINAFDLLTVSSTLWVGKYPYVDYSIFDCFLQDTDIPLIVGVLFDCSQFMVPHLKQPLSRKLLAKIV
ncbi:hypothetical protein NPIL_686441 [Nephila pilipes]|uniref:Uncharacterized protein n=1 Tax=Nephila pilipes TaxID=299642 RepID=A0A8X6QN78_NEPPI|nr:hypothetical protein NPIL_686441 [Nephila pilipes]